MVIVIPEVRKDSFDELKSIEKKENQNIDEGILFIIGASICDALCDRPNRDYRLSLALLKNLKRLNKLFFPSHSLKDMLICQYIAQTYINLKDSASCIKYIKKAELIYDTLDIEDDLEMIGIFHRVIGSLSFLLQDYERGLKHFKRVVHIYNILSTPNYMQNPEIYCDMGLAYFYLKKEKTAIKHFRRAETIFKELAISDSTSRADTLYNMALAYENLKKQKKAIHYKKKAVLMYNRLSIVNNKLC